MIIQEIHTGSNYRKNLVIPPSMMQLIEHPDFIKMIRKATQLANKYLLQLKEIWDLAVIDKITKRWLLNFTKAYMKA